MNGEFNPLVSIIIPVFNGEKYVREAITSALSQQYISKEIIVVDDGSTDATREICTSFSDRIKFFHKRNGGCASALNLGIKNSTGQYISWLSHDDVYPEYKLQLQLSHLSALANKETILYGPYELIDESSAVFAKVVPHLEKHPLNKLNTSLYPLFKGVMNGCTMLIPKACFDKIGYFDESLLATQDYDLWLKFLKVYPVAYGLKPMVRTRLHSEQGSKKIPTNLEECNRLWCHMLDSLSEQEMLTIEPSVFAFYAKTAQFLETTPYADAYSYYLKRKSDYIDNIKVSVVIPFKDRFDLLMEAVESVKAQTHRNVELILVDDGSVGECPISSGHFDGIEIIYLNQDNQGPAAARNLGVGYASGQYIAFLDSDDLFTSSKIRTQLECMLSSQVDLTYTSYDRLDLDGKEVTRKIDSGGDLKKEFPELIINCPIATPTVMGKREVFLKNKFPTEYKIGEDVSCWLSIAAEHNIQGIPDSLTIVRTRGSSASISHQKQIVGLLNIARYVASSPIYDLHNDKLQELIQICADYIKANVCISAKQ